MDEEFYSGRPMDIVIRSCGRSELVSSLFQSLLQTPVVSELVQLGCSVVAINDWPDDVDVTRSLQ